MSNHLAPHEVTQAYYQNVLDRAIRETATLINNTLSELPHGVERLDSVSFFHQDEPGADATVLDHTSYQIADDSTFDKVSACDVLREAGKTAREHVIVCVMITTTMPDGNGGRFARIYAASAFERRLCVLDGDLVHPAHATESIVGVLWRWHDYTRKNWGKQQPFIAAFFEGFEDGIAHCN